MDKKLLARLVWNPKTETWDLKEYNGEFRELNPRTLAALYQEARNTMEDMREKLIEEALETKGYAQANALIEEIRKKK